MSENDKLIRDLVQQEYKWGFVTDIDSDTLPPGLSEDVIRFISAKKQEPDWLLEFRLKAYRHWLTLEEPRWQKVQFPPIFCDCLMIKIDKKFSHGLM